MDDHVVREQKRTLAKLAKKRSHRATHLEFREFNIDVSSRHTQTPPSITANSAKMTKRTKKVGVTGKYGTRYVLNPIRQIWSVVGAQENLNSTSPTPSTSERERERERERSRQESATTTRSRVELKGKMMAWE